MNKNDNNSLYEIEPSLVITQRWDIRSCPRKTCGRLIMEDGGCGYICCHCDQVFSWKHRSPSIFLWRHKDSSIVLDHGDSPRYFNLTSSPYYLHEEKKIIPPITLEKYGLHGKRWWTPSRTRLLRDSYLRDLVQPGDVVIVPNTVNIEPYLFRFPTAIDCERIFCV